MTYRRKQRGSGQSPSPKGTTLGATRRDFIRTAACAAVGTTALTSSILDLKMIGAAAAATVPTDYKALVCIFLYGGNDGNNLLIPTDASTYSNYAAARSALTITQSQALPIQPLTNDGHTYGLHPSCPELQSLFNGGKCAIVANVGTLVAPITQAQFLSGGAAIPANLFSHNDQQVLWQTSIADKPSSTGWGGRCADLLVSANGNAQVSMSITLNGSNTFEIGNTTGQYAITPLGTIGLYNISSQTQQAINQIMAVPRTNLYENELQTITNRAIANNALVGGALATAPTFATKFPNTTLGNQLAMIAKLIAVRGSLGHKRQIFFASVSGYDLHGGEGAASGTHATLLQELSSCMNALYAATGELGVANSVTQFTASDFGRSLGFNGGGSDHGWGNHHLVLGGAVQGKKIYGTFPRLAPLTAPGVFGPDDTGMGRWIPTTSVEEYSATMAKWFGVSSTDMTTVFPNIGRFAHPDLGFMG
jgi:uncharacterized protein (DUF1501 family)